MSMSNALLTESTLYHLFPILRWTILGRLIVMDNKESKGKNRTPLFLMFFMDRTAKLLAVVWGNTIQQFKNKLNVNEKNNVIPISCLTEFIHSFIGSTKSIGSVTEN